jgi:hypothetical protein
VRKKLEEDRANDGLGAIEIAARVADSPPFSPCLIGLALDCSDEGILGVIFRETLFHDVVAK